MGGYAPASRTSSTTVTTAATKLLDRSLERATAIIVNDSANVIYLSFGPNPSLNQGIRLNANGGAIWFGRDTDIIYYGEVWAIAGSSSGVTITEF